MKLKRITLEELKRQPRSNVSIDNNTLDQAQAILDQVRQQGDAGLRQLAVKFGEIEANQAVMVDDAELSQSIEAIDSETRATLKRTADRIHEFAARQLSCFSDLECEIDGGRAGHTIVPVQRVGCYVPGGRYPLVSTALMTAVTAKAAGCREVLLATPKPDTVMLAAAKIAGADQVLRVGGAQSVAAMAFGTERVDKVDLIVGPGNRWVTAAKKLVSGEVGIDMLAGPTELVVLADNSARPEKIAADLLAQAEHDTDARPMLVAIGERLVDQVELFLAEQVERLSTAATAKSSVAANGLAIICSSIEEAIEACNHIAPEHLELMCEDATQVQPRILHAGCLFLGDNCGEVFGDYGVGPNHTLPTAGTARYSAGLNVINFVRIRSFIHMDNQPSNQLFDDVSKLAEMEGLAGHKAACEIRRG